MKPVASSRGDSSSAISAPPTMSGTMAVAAPAIRPTGAGSSGGGSFAGAGSSAANTTAKIDAQIDALDFLITGDELPIAVRPSLRVFEEESRARWSLPRPGGGLSRSRAVTSKETIRSAGAPCDRGRRGSSR